MNRQRRALSAPGGKIVSGGEPGGARLIAQALARGTGELGTDERALPHGFHSYPARFHPRLVRTLLEGAGGVFGEPSGARRGASGEAVPSRMPVLMDPFCGSGTTLVEGALAGLRARGVDANPLAVELSRLKATPMPLALRKRFLDEAQAAAARSFERVKARARTRTSGEAFDDPKKYAPHVFRELVGLREEIDAADGRLRSALLLVLSSIVVKVSRQTSDTEGRPVERTIGKGLPSRIFARKAEELSRQLAAFAERVPPETPRPEVRLGDARKLDHVGRASVDLVITSPPYLGTYDYTEQHARRFGWLGLDASGFEATEIGARRRARTPDEALAVWQSDVDAFVAEIARVLAPGGRAFVVIGDSAVGKRRIAGDAALRHAAQESQLTVAAWAAQERPNFYAPAESATRREHLLLLRR